MRNGVVGLLCVFREKVPEAKTYEGLRDAWILKKIKNCTKTRLPITGLPAASRQRISEHSCDTHHDQHDGHRSHNPQQPFELAQRLLYVLCDGVRLRHDVVAGLVDGVVPPAVAILGMPPLHRPKDGIGAHEVADVDGVAQIDAVVLRPRLYERVCVRLDDGHVLRRGATAHCHQQQQCLHNS